MRQRFYPYGELPINCDGDHCRHSEFRGKIELGSGRLQKRSAIKGCVPLVASKDLVRRKPELENAE